MYIKDQLSKANEILTNHKIARACPIAYNVAIYCFFLKIVELSILAGFLPDLVKSFVFIIQETFLDSALLPSSKCLVNE